MGGGLCNGDFRCSGHCDVAFVSPVVPANAWTHRRWWHPHPDPQAGEGAIERSESRAIHIAPVREEMLFAKCGAFCSLPRLRGRVGVGAAAGGGGGGGGGSRGREPLHRSRICIRATRFRRRPPPGPNLRPFIYSALVFGIGIGGSLRSPIMLRCRRKRGSRWGCSKVSGRGRRPENFPS